jgi:hypothetical protein
MADLVRMASSLSAASMAPLKRSTVMLSTAGSQSRRARHAPRYWRNSRWW